MSQTERSLLIVNYRTAKLAGAAIASARDASSERLHVVVVDNSCDDAEILALSGCGADRVVAAPKNLGYAGGINFGLAWCEGEDVLISNPDVHFMPDCIDLLADQMRRGVGLSGPCFVWDDAAEWMLPPAEDPALKRKASEIMAARSGIWRRRFSRLRTRDRIRFWSRTAPADADVLSGAVMLTKRSLIKTVGGFDERFPLYFEEIDFMRRLRKKRQTIRYVPRALCRHIYNQSAGVTPEARRRYADSEVAFFRKWNGRSAEKMMHWFGREISDDPAQFTELKEPAIILPGLEPDRFMVEASPLPSFLSAAGHFPHAKRVALPREVWASYKSDRLYLHVVEKKSAKVLSRYVVRKT